MKVYVERQIFNASHVVEINSNKISLSWIWVLECSVGLLVLIMSKVKKNRGKNKDKGFRVYVLQRKISKIYTCYIMLTIEYRVKRSNKKKLLRYLNTYDSNKSKCEKKMWIQWKFMLIRLYYEIIAFVFHFSEFFFLFLIHSSYQTFHSIMIKIQKINEFSSLLIFFHSSFFILVSRKKRKTFIFECLWVMKGEDERGKNNLKSGEKC